MNIAQSGLLLVGACAVCSAELQGVCTSHEWREVRVTDNCRDGLEMLRARSPCLVLLGIEPSTFREALSLLRTIRREKLDGRVLARSSPEWDYAVQALRAGASGYVRRPASANELAKAIRCVLSGGFYMEAEVAQSLALQFVDKLRHRGSLSSQRF